ncbi:hypothetical protein [Rhodopila sp.]|uniref:LexA family protein n=1 Tax=Rhodopila sp. TaxID=2480087 RepID=UPI003D100CFD
MIYSVTDRQKSVLDAITSYTKEHNGLCPTLREIMAATGLNSISGVATHLKALERRGRIKRLPGLARGIAILEPQDDRIDAYNAVYLALDRAKAAAFKHHGVAGMREYSHAIDCLEVIKPEGII